MTADPLARALLRVAELAQAALIQGMRDAGYFPHHDDAYLNSLPVCTCQEAHE
jgi:hypothetical protein